MTSSCVICPAGKDSEGACSWVRSNRNSHFNALTLCTLSDTIMSRDSLLAIGEPWCLSVCAVPAPLGYFCTNGTARLSLTNACSNPASYCVEGSGASLTVDVGFYAVAGPAGLFVNQTRCPSGSFCATGVRSLCTAGRFGAQAGETSPVCTGDCTQGHYCPAGSTVPTQEPCGAPTMYCPAVRAHALFVGALTTAAV